MEMKAVRDREPFGSALAEIRARIRVGAILPGQALVVDDLARDLRLSPTPVREALAYLTGAGLVVGREGRARGYAVSALSAADLADLYRLHALQVAFGLAEASRRRLAPATAGDDAEEGGAELAERAGRFFQRLVEASGNRTLLRAHQALAHRLHLPRTIEPRVFPDAEPELARLISASSSADLGRAVRHYHRRRVSRSEQIIALIGAPA
ncbi:hypothetical protein ASE17_05100 [Phenylobacterium sp. Root77]|nr:hypothetical protein ASC73_09330 [Phenylobacterium sp. Root1277]KRC44860.1 hypothetical protein ASE17_05100 [Phenylobacterium sp. Root77]